MTESIVVKHLIDLLNESNWSFFLYGKNYSRMNRKVKLDILKAVALGKQCARLIRGVYLDVSPSEILYKLGVKIETVDSKSDWGTSIVCAEYLKSPPIVKIYNFALKRLAKFSSDLNLNLFQDIDNLREISLSHELFHHLESYYYLKNSHPYYFLRKKTFFHYSMKSCQALSEVAAQSFAQELLQLEVNPSILNILLRFRTEKERRENESSPQQAAGYQR